MKPFSAAVVALFVAVALVLMAVKGWFGLAFKAELRPLEIVVLCVNLFIAFSVQYYFATRVSDRRAEKNLLIDELRDGISNLRLCRDALAVCHEARTISDRSKTAIVLQFRRLANCLSNFETALETSNCGKAGCRKCLDTCETVLMPAYFNYKKAATGGRFPTKPFNQSQIAEQENTYRTLHRELIGAIFKLNRCRQS